MPGVVVLAIAFGLLAWPADAFTLLPNGPERGERLRLLLRTGFRETPARDAPSLRTRDAGHELEVRSVSRNGGVVWIESEDGWIEASRVDRIPEPVTGDLPVGREGLASGRVLPDAYVPSDLVVVPSERRATGYRWREMELREDALGAFERLFDAASSAGWELGIASAFRGADYQRGLYARALARDPDQKTSAPPGRSEHQLGTTVDVVVPGAPAFSASIGKTDAYRWIEANAARFGVVVSFSEARHRARGVAFEPWHLRWVGDAIDHEEAW